MVMARAWMEVILPLYSVFAIFVYFRPATLPLDAEQQIGQRILMWLMWAGVAALTGVLAISALFLTFYLLYSPFYLVGQIRRLGGPTKWVDKREFRFYVWCFTLLCLLSGVAILNPVAAAVTFTLLAGSSQFLWRALI